MGLDAAQLLPASYRVFESIDLATHSSVSIVDALFTYAPI